MKKYVMTVVTVVLMGILPPAFAHDRDDAAAGLLLGGTAGAVVGHQIGGRDGTLVGGLIGAALGYSISQDNDHERHHGRTVYAYDDHDRFDHDRGRHDDRRGHDRDRHDNGRFHDDRDWH